MKTNTNAPPEHSTLNEHSALLLKDVLGTFSQLRDLLHEQSVALASEYVTRRAALDQGFCNLNLLIGRQNRGRSISLYWYLYHFKSGGLKGSTMVTVTKKTRYTDIAMLRRRSPEWIHPLVEEIEGRCRPVRQALAEITAIERRIRAIADRLDVDLSDR